MMRKFSLICLLVAMTIGYSALASGGFHLTPIYNYEKADLVKQLQITKTDTGKLNLLFSLAFNNNALVESPSYIDTIYIKQIISINERAKLFDDKPFRTLLLALREGVNTNYAAEIGLLTTTIDQFDEQDMEIVMLLIEARWIFNVANQQEEKHQFYTRKLSYYLQKGQYRNAAACYHCLAGYYVFKGDINSSINNYLKAGEQFQPFSHLWYMHEFVIVASRYSEWGNPEKSYAYLQKAQQVANNSGTGDDRFGLLSNSMLLEYGLKHYQKSLAYIEQLGALTDESSQATITTYEVLNLVALNRLTEAWDVLSKIKDQSGQSGLSRVIQNGGYDLDYAFYKYYLATKELSKAETYLLRTYENARKDATVQNEVTYLKELSQFYGSQRNTDKAWQYTVLFNRLNDSIQSRTNRFNVASYENEQKEIDQNRKMALLQQQHAIQEATIGQRNKIIWISLIGLGAVLGSLIFIYRQLQVNKRNLNDLKATQAQLVQSEKMASLGDLTAGIAHEIQNPLNFVNNFSEVNKELLLEMNDEIDKGNLSEVKLIAQDVIGNEEKINHHGKRADSIVKGMLQHSRSSSSEKERTDINALADEYLRLAYHGLRAKDNSFNATMKTDFDVTIANINIIPQDIGRVLLNLYNNAFYAVGEKKKTAGAGYEPTIVVSTKKLNDKITISVKDNGNGIPQHVVDKIFQPFFTTKPTGVGTGLGLSLSYDIIKAHGGEIRVKTKEGEGTEFSIQLAI